MATTQSHWDSEVPTSALDGADDPYSKDKTYLVIFAILFAVTLAEVATYFLTDFILFKGALLVPTLLVMGGFKFVLVASYFMHLRFDKKVLSILFYSGLVLAICVYIAVLTLFRVWWPNHHAVCESVPQFDREESLVKSQTVCPPTRG